MAARAASGYPSPTSVTLGRHSEPLTRPPIDAHGRPMESHGRSSVPLGGSAAHHAQPPQPQRRPSPPPLVRSDHVQRSAPPPDHRADLRIDTRLDPRASHPPGHPYYASAARQPVTPPSHRPGSAASGPSPPGPPPPPARLPAGHPHQHPYHSQPVPVQPRVARPHQPESSSRPKHHLSHTSSAALPPPPSAASSSSRGPLPSSASAPPPAHAHQPKVLRMPEQEDDQPLDLGAPAKRRASPDMAEGQPTTKSRRPEETKLAEEHERSEPSGSSPQKVRTGYIIG